MSIIDKPNPLVTVFLVCEGNIENCRNTVQRGPVLL